MLPLAFQKKVILLQGLSLTIPGTGTKTIQRKRRVYVLHDVQSNKLRSVIMNQALSGPG